MSKQDYNLEIKSKNGEGVLMYEGVMYDFGLAIFGVISNFITKVIESKGIEGGLDLLRVVEIGFQAFKDYTINIIAQRIKDNPEKGFKEMIDILSKNDKDGIFKPIIDSMSGGEDNIKKEEILKQIDGVRELLKKKNK